LRELLLHTGQFDSILRPLRPGHTRHDTSKIEFQFYGILNLTFNRHAEESLSAIVTFISPAMLIGAASGSQIIDRLSVNREEAHGGAVFGGHVGNGGAVHDRQGGRAGPKELDELPNDFRLS